MCLPACPWTNLAAGASFRAPVAADVAVVPRAAGSSLKLGAREDAQPQVWCLIAQSHALNPFNLLTAYYYYQPSSACLCQLVLHFDLVCQLSLCAIVLRALAPGYTASVAANGHLNYLRTTDCPSHTSPAILTNSHGYNRIQRQRRAFCGCSCAADYGRTALTTTLVRPRGDAAQALDGRIPQALNGRIRHQHATLLASK